MTELTVHDSIKQAVITRLATVNQALHFIAITKAKPAKVTVEEVLDLAKRIEHWAWRNLCWKRRGRAS